MKILDYVYYRFYILFKSISLKSSYFQSRIALFLSLSTGSNVLVVLKFLGVDILNRIYLTVGLFLVWLFVLLRIFSNTTREERIKVKFEDESEIHKILGSLGIVLYMLGSLVIFILVMMR